MKFLVDTCVISEMMKTNPNSEVINWINKYPQDVLFLSVLSLGEIRKGINKLEQGPKKVQLNFWLENYILAKFENNLLHIDTQIALLWGEKQAIAEKSGNRIALIYGLISATALYYDFTVVTRNTKDFIKTGCKLFNPWE